MSLRAAIVALTRAVEGPGITCVVVDDADPAKSPALAAAAARASAGKRMLYRATDDVWPELVAAADEGAAPEWIACEPLLEQGGAIGAVVVTGAAGSDIDVLAQLPRLTGAFAALLSGARFSKRASTLVHGMNNQLATVIVNVDLAFDVAAKQYDSTDKAELLRSLGYTRRAARNLKERVAELAVLVPRGEQET